MLHAAVGLYPDVPGGKRAAASTGGDPLGAVTVRGLRVAGEEVDIEVDRNGAVSVTGLPAGISIEIVGND